MLEVRDWQAIAVTLQLCVTTTLILFIVGMPLAWWLAHTRSRWRPAVEALVALPLVLPPTVLGFYLLIALGPNGPIGGLLQSFGIQHLAFSFSGILIGSFLYSLPFMVQPLHDGFRSLGRQPIEIAATLGAGPIDRFFSIVVPLMKTSIFTAGTLSFAHTMGEFGVVLMIGGSIAGETQVLSIAIYDATEAMNYSRAHILSAMLLISSFLILSALFFFRARPQAVWK